MRFGLRKPAHHRFLSQTACHATPCTVFGNRPGGRAERHHAVQAFLLYCRNKVMYRYYRSYFLARLSMGGRSLCRASLMFRIRGRVRVLGLGFCVRVRASVKGWVVLVI